MDEDVQVLSFDIEIIKEDSDLGGCGFYVGGVVKFLEVVFDVVKFDRQLV